MGLSRDSHDNEYTILRQYLLQCRGIRPNSFVSRMVLDELDDRKIQEKKSLANDNEFAILREHVLRCKHVGKDSIVRRKVLQSLNRKCTRLAKVQKLQHASSVPSHIERKSSSPRASVILVLLRFFAIESPLAILFAAFILVYHLEYAFDQYLIPIMDAARWADSNRLQNEFTYYDRKCDRTDISTTSLEDIILSADSSTEKAVDTIMTHGSFILPDLLSEEVSNELRTHILKRNDGLTYEEDIPLDTPENRWSFGIGANESPAVTAALKELSYNALLTSSLEKLLGPNPAVVEITTITSGKC